MNRKTKARRLRAAKAHQQQSKHRRQQRKQLAAKLDKLEGMTKTELHTVASEHGVEFNTKTTKPQLIERIRLAVAA